MGAESSLRYPALPGTEQVWLYQTVKLLTLQRNLIYVAWTLDQFCFLNSGKKICISLLGTGDALDDEEEEEEEDDSDEDENASSDEDEEEEEMSEDEEEDDQSESAYNYSLEEEEEDEWRCHHWAFPTLESTLLHLWNLKWLLLYFVS